VKNTGEGERSGSSGSIITYSEISRAFIRSDGGNCMGVELPDDLRTKLRVASRDAFASCDRRQLSASG
jgi:hypothetical protein